MKTPSTSTLAIDVLGKVIEAEIQRGLAAVTIVVYKTEVYCTLQVEALHNWPNCPFDEVSYLRDLHRHQFGIKAYVAVSHTDRDVEFIMLKHKIQSYLAGYYYDQVKQLHVFGAKSCEMLATELIEKFNLTRCEVDEDGENGAVVTVLPPTYGRLM